MTCTTGWRAALDAEATTPHLEDAVRRWLDAALHHPHLRGPICWSFIEAATPTNVPARYARPAAPSPPVTKIMINMVREWAAADPTDPARKKIKEDIGIPLTRPWWLRLLKTAYVTLRTLANTAQQPPEPG